jgi:hypothetical protein
MKGWGDGSAFFWRKGRGVSLFQPGEIKYLHFVAQNVLKYSKILGSIKVFKATLSNFSRF